MFTGILAFLTYVSPTIVGGIAAYFTSSTARVQAGAAVATGLGTEVVHAQTTYMQTAMDHWETRWGIGLTVLLTVFHYGSVVMDSVFHFGWRIAALPTPMNEWEGTIILAPFALAGALGVARTVLNIFK